MFLAHSLPESPPLLELDVRKRLSDVQWTLLSDPCGWHQQFYNEVTREIDEDIFSVLYGKGGRPNSPIYLLVSMLILKEGKNWTEEVLFEQCHFNLQVRCALGLDFGDSIPCATTYTNFKANLNAHIASGGENLLELCYRKLTTKQAKKYGVKGKKIRMDSKLLDSNIAMNSRLELVLGVLIKFYKSLDDEAKQQLTNPQQTMLEDISKKQAHQHRHSLSKAEQKVYLEDLGNLVYQLHEVFKNQALAKETAYLTLAKLWEDHYELVQPADSSDPKEEVVQSKKKDDINGDVLQSPHDTDAGYRRKESGTKTQKVRGFSSNITECFDKGAPRLITDVQTQGVTTGDSEYFETAIIKTQDITGHAAEEGHTDGAYHSPTNIAFVKALVASGQLFKWYIPKMQGKVGDFEFEWEGEQLIVKQKSTGNSYTTLLTASGKHRIKLPTGKYRYFTQKDLDNYKRRQQIKEFPKEILKQRANVEATIRQVFCTLDGNKTKYRGLVANHNFVLKRVIWVNFKRIVKFNNKKQKNQEKQAKNQANTIIMTLLRSCLSSAIAMVSGLVNHRPTQHKLSRSTRRDQNSLTGVFTKFYSDISRNFCF